VRGVRTSAFSHHMRIRRVRVRVRVTGAKMDYTQRCEVQFQCHCMSMVTALTKVQAVLNTLLMAT